ncbi:MAG TPA: phage tail protein [Stellaceae bacterium]|nr:phage tail protein [Stellaceae bacterium]
MANFLTGGSKGRTNKPPVAESSLRIQSSVNGSPIPIVHGQQRIAGNLIDYLGFTATPVSAPSQGGKGGVLGGGGAKGASTQGYTYSVDVLFGLCEGPIDQVNLVWNNKSPEPLSDLNLSAFGGPVGQAPWPFMVSAEPGHALGYSSLAYAGANPIALGQSAELPNLNFEVRGAISGAVTESHTITSPYKFTASSFGLADAVTEQVVVPAAAPYQIQAANPYAANALPVLLGGFPAGPGGVSEIPGCSAQGVIYGANGLSSDGTPFTRVNSSPSTGQYAVTSTGLYSFAAGDAGLQITIIDLALSPGVNYCENPTGTTAVGLPIVSSLSSTLGLALGQLVTGPGIPPGTVIQNGVGSGSFTADLTSGSVAVANISAGVVLAAGAAITDSAGALPANTTLAAVTPATVTLDTAAVVSAAGDAITFGGTATGTVSASTYTQITGVNPVGALSVGQDITDGYGDTYSIAGISGTTVTVNAPYINASFYGLGDPISFSFTRAVAADVNAGSAVLANLSTIAALEVGMGVVSDSAGAVSGNIVAIGAAAASLSQAATASHAGDTLTYANSITLSNPANASGTGVTLTFYGAALSQVNNAEGEIPAAGQFQLSVQPGSYGQYTFSAADQGKTVVITDVPDADPAASLVDFLSNPRYGAGFPAQYIGDLSLLSDYAYAQGLFISPAIVASQAASAYLKDFATGLNGEFVWSSGKLTFAPYGDATLSGNGKTYTPPWSGGPIYSLGDDDFLPNQGTASVGVSAFTSDDPVVCARKRQSDALNDLKLEYLDRGNSYNPAIVEAKDDAAINLFGLRPADTKQLHFFCIEAAALASAQLQLGRQQIHNQYSFTVPWYFILLDPMDLIAITDAGLGLDAQLVRILEITENQQDWSLTITAEEVLDGTGATPAYGSQPKSAFTPNYNSDPGLPAAPVIFEPPPALTGGSLEVWLLTGGGANYGGADVWVSSDGDSYKLAGRISGGSSRIGVTTADFPSGSDPDTADTLAVDLSAVGGALLSGTQADADAGNMLCAVAGYAYAPAPVLSSTAGGALAAATYYARATYVFASGEGPPSPEESAAVAASELLTAASPAAQAGATGWNLYVGTVAGGETKQNSSAIAIGASWAEPTAGLVAGSPPPPAETGYELLAYSSADLTAASKYDLRSYLRRGLFGTTIGDHPASSSFARLDGTQFSYPYDKSRIGSTVYFKLTPFNLWGGGEYDLAQVEAYAHVIEGPPAPRAVTVFSAQQVGGAIIFAWSPLADVALKGYDILFGPQGGSLASATLLTEAGAGTEMTNAAVPAGAWTFYIRGRDIADQLGPATTANLAVVNFNTVVVTIAEHPDWLGAKSGFLVHHTGVLVPDSTKLANQHGVAELFTAFVPYPVAAPSYTCATLDAGFDGGLRLWASWSAASGGNGANENSELAFSLDSWPSSAGDPGTFLPWGYIGNLVDVRYAKGRITENTATPAYVAALSVSADVGPASYSVNGFAVGAGGSTLSFASAPGLPAQFHNLPNVQVTSTNAAAVTGTATGITTTSCTITLYNSSGASVAGTANILLTGE